ncbi:hypothetical protein REG_1989 [Candidatus Regiella insecticola LSR1]|uniref:Uncharacterized protein n=1 Tax=Candidatus Regiella insecticola LSR1 TaxID=663321 RepID=E0WV74_9ENTR|nr:fimbria/pilus periplasmic chaperone [Candidatus Regiella insecticola]EFL91092.1 hypothetical protein REG_1989 [Candidatus Regiella insecticola LSR1]
MIFPYFLLKSGLFKSLLLKIALLLSVTAAHAQLLAIPTRITVEGLEKDQTIRVINKGDIPIYLNVILERIENPGKNPENKTPIGQIQHPEMIFNPTRITLGAKQERHINLIPLTTPLQETLYRLYITPVTQTKIKGIDDKKITVPLTFGVAYGVLIHHLPASAQQTQRWEYQCLEPSGIKLTAMGKIHNSFNDLRVPNSQQEIPSSQNVYPGTPILLPNIKQLSGEVEEKSFSIVCP